MKLDGYPPPVGAKLRLRYDDVGGRPNINNRLLHVRGHVDGMPVVRRWLKHKQYWQYELIPPTQWHVWLTCGTAGLLTVEWS